MHVTRRNLLRALGLLGPAYFVPSALRRRTAQAADPAIPTRIMFIYTQHGTLLRQWVAPPAGASTPTETSFELGPILQPLGPIKNKVTIVEGLDWHSTFIDPTAPANGHANGQTHALSAIHRANPNAAGGISIDQFIAKQLNSPAPVTVLPSLEISARYDAASAQVGASWLGPNQLVAPLSSPSAIYKRLFPSGPPSAMPATDPAVAALARRRKSVLDAVLAEFNAVNRPLSANDRMRLEAHAGLIRDLESEQSLQGVAPGSCSAPTLADLTATYSKDCPNGKGAICVQDSAAALSNLAVAAFSCDLTRVITMDIDGLPDVTNNPAVGAAGGMHEFLHGMDDLSLFEKDRFGKMSNSPSRPSASDPTNLNTAIKWYSGYAQIISNLLQKLDAVPEPDGTTLLDHTIVVWCGELGTSNHAVCWVNYLLGGGAATGLKNGRYLSIPRTQPKPNTEYFSNAGVPHNSLFVSLANLVGLKSVTSFGESSISAGPLPQLTG